MHSYSYYPYYIITFSLGYCNEILYGNNNDNRIYISIAYNHESKFYFCRFDEILRIHNFNQ
uniref:Sema domain-containing protein n=1 Tax=Strongyloides papillosus TaxID=174720 RepID=A0A0N5BXI8_STREA